MNLFKSKWIKVLLSTICVLSFSCNTTSSNDDENESKTFKIVIYGDSQSNHKIHHDVCTLIDDLNPDAVFHAGDIVENSQDSNEWIAFNQETAKYRRKIPFYPTKGNHDVGTTNFLKYEPTPSGKAYYSVNVSKLHFIVLDSNDSLNEGSTQYKWMIDDLINSSSKSAAIIAIFHHPPFGCANDEHSGDEKNLKESLVPIFDLYGVKMVFSGHNHLYERIKHKKSWYIITGGAGGSLHKNLKSCHKSEIQDAEHHLCELVYRNGQLRLKVYLLNKQKIDDLILDL